MDESAQCIYRNDGVIWCSLSERTGELDYESLGGSRFAEVNADENATGPLLGYHLSDVLHTTLIFCSICKISAIFILHIHLAEGTYAATNPSDFPLHLSSNGSFMYWETLIREAKGLTGKRCWMSGWEERRLWCGFVNCTLQRKSVFFFSYYYEIFFPIPAQRKLCQLWINSVTLSTHWV